jgi:uncharacterized membrane protein YgdD (TMEM256/DUF423 family)
MTAIGFFMFVIAILMAMFDSALGKPRGWYAVVGTLLFVGGLAGMVVGASTALWRVMP